MRKSASRRWRASIARAHLALRLLGLRPARGRRSARPLQRHFPARPQIQLLAPTLDCAAGILDSLGFGQIRAICAAISFRSGPILVAPSTQADAALDTVARALIAARSRDTGAVTPHKAIAAALGVSRDVVVGGYCAIVRGLIRSLQPADDGVEAGKVVELEVAQIRGVEIVAGDVDMIALPERLLKFAIAGRVQRHHAVVRLAGECGQVMVRCREREAGRQETPAPGSEVGAITDVRMRLGRVRHPRGAFRGQVRERADVAPRRPIAWLIPS